MCRKLGTSLATEGRCHLSTPSRKYCRSRNLQRFAVPLDGVHIIANPLLNQGCEEGCGKTEYESYKPENVHTDVGFQWFERREWERRSGRDGNLRSDGEDLLGDLIKEGDILLKVIHHLVLGVDFQVLFAVDYECGKDSGK